MNHYFLNTRNKNTGKNYEDDTRMTKMRETVLIKPSLNWPRILTCPHCLLPSLMCYLLDLRTDSEGQRVESAGCGEDTHRFLKTSSRRSCGRLSAMSGWRKRPEDPLSTMPRISTHSRGFSTWKHLSSVTRNRLRFTPGLCKACFRISPKSITMLSSS